MSRRLLIAIAGIAALAAGGAGAAGCGSSSSSQGSPSSGSSQSASTPTAAALSAEAQSVATGDIPDNQVFLVYRNPQARYSIKYPEGWTQSGGGGDISFKDKNNVVHVVVAPGAPPSAASVAAELAHLKASTPTLTFTAPAPIHLTAGPAIKASYTTLSAPNPVTGKQLLLIVDRYELTRGGKRVTVDLGTAKGVDNVDAYRKMINSFAWL